MAEGEGVDPSCLATWRWFSGPFVRAAHATLRLNCQRSMVALERLELSCLSASDPKSGAYAFRHRATGESDWSRTNYGAFAERSLTVRGQIQKFTDNN